MKISEINIQLIKPSNGLVAFASVVLDDKIFLQSLYPCTESVNLDAVVGLKCFMALALV